jgi:hypothetical protein
MGMSLTSRNMFLSTVLFQISLSYNNAMGDMQDAKVSGTLKQLSWVAIPPEIPRASLEKIKLN